MMKKFNDLVRGEKPVLVDFYADWCGPCRTLAPELKKLAGLLDGKATIIKVNVDQNPVAAQTYQVRGVPTLMLFQKGKIVWRQAGVLSADQLLRIITEKTEANV